MRKAKSHNESPGEQDAKDSLRKAKAHNESLGKEFNTCSKPGTEVKLQRIYERFHTYSCQPHTETVIMGGALKIKCRNKPLTVQARLCQQQDFDKIVTKMEGCGLVSLIKFSILSLIISTHHLGDHRPNRRT